MSARVVSRLQMCRIIVDKVRVGRWDPCGRADGRLKIAQLLFMKSVSLNVHCSCEVGIPSVLR